MEPDLDIAATLECEPELLPHLPEILEGFDSLGSDPRRVVELLEAEDVARRVGAALDLCCGKGATSIALARRFGMRVDGVDALEPFIAAARSAAAAAGVGELCRFTTGDLCDAVARPGGYDLVLFSSVGPILGGITATVTHLATPLRSGGSILIEDCVLLPGAPVRPGFEGHADLEETTRRIEASGVEVVAVRHAPEAAQTRHAGDMARILAGAARLTARRPDLAAAVARYVARQRGESAYLERWTREVTWLLRKTSPDRRSQR